MKIVKNFGEFTTIPTVRTIPAGTLFIVDDDYNKSVWFKTGNDEIIICLDDGYVTDLDCAGDDDINYNTPVHILNATLTVE